MISANSRDTQTSKQNSIVVENNQSDEDQDEKEKLNNIQQDSSNNKSIPPINHESRTTHSSSWNFILLSLLFITIELIIYLYNNKIASYLLIATNCSSSSEQSPEFSTISCLSPRRVIYGWSSNAQPQILLSILLYPIIFPNWITLIVGLIILYSIRESDSFSKPSIFKHLIRLYQIQYSTFIIRMVLSFIRFRAFGWTEDLLWAFDAHHFVSCNMGGTSFILYHLVKYFSDVSSQQHGGILKMIVPAFIAFILHFTSHLPLTYIPMVSSTFTNQIPSNYLIDHISAIILTIVFSE